MSFRDFLKLCSPDQELTYSIITTPSDHAVWVKHTSSLSDNSIKEPTPKNRLFIEVFVTDEYGEPLAGASLTVRSSKQLFKTGPDGGTTIHTDRVPDSVYSTYACMEPALAILSDESPLIIRMRAHDPMNEAIVTGYATCKRREYTGDRVLVGRTELDLPSMSNPLIALQGKVSGLRITQTSGTPGASSHVSLRGKMSLLNGEDPLYIIDGVPFAPGNQSVSNISSGNSAGSLNPFSFIALDDIESIEVLKDADATAIYGSRGANGVILITSRRGAPGKLRLNFSGSTGLSHGTFRPHLLNIHQYSAMRREAITNDGGRPDSTTAPELVRWDTTRSVDWGKWLVGGAGNTAKVQLSASGGTDTTNYFLSLGKLRETNVFPTKPTHDLLSLHGSLSHHSANGRLTIQASGLFGWDDNRQFTTDLTRLQFLTPNAPPLSDKNGNPVFTINGVTMANPLSFIAETYEARSRNRLVSTSIQYRFWQSLIAHATMGYNDVRTKEYSEIPMRGHNPAWNPTGSSYSATTGYKSWILEPQLEDTINRGDWKIRLLAGATWQGLRSTVSTLSADGFTNDAWLRQPDSAQDLSRDSQTVDYLYKAVFGRLNINWKNSYILNLTGRRDGSSRFASRRYGNFGAAGIAWIFSDLPFFREKAPFISLGKLRASYGITGNDLIGGGNRYLDNWAPTSAITFQNTPGTYSTGPVNSQLTWESIRKMEIATDWSFGNNRHLFTAAWYRDRSDNQLLPDSFPQVGSPITLRKQPVVIQNSGWEFSLTSKIIDRKDIEWTASANISFPVNRLLAFPGFSTSPFGKDLVLGESLNVLRGYKLLGVDPQTGVFRFKDLNSDGQITEADRTVVGNLDVTCFGGIQNTFRWRRWQLNTNIEFRRQTGANYQAAIYQASLPGSISSGFYSNETTDILNRWKNPGDRASYQKLTTDLSSPAGIAATNFLGSDGILTDASFLRLKSLSVSWTWPDLLLRKMHLQEGKLSLETQNIFTLTPYKGADPEIQSILTLPPLKTIELHIQVKF